MKSVVLLLATASTLAMISPAAAQVAPSTTSDERGAPAPQSVPDATTPDSGVGLADIVVTAQRVSESAQRAPIAISVVKPDDLLRQAVTRPEDLSRVVPALVAESTGGSYTTFVLRGVGNTTINAYSDPAVAFNYDGVYIGRPSSTSGSFYDLQRVEVLKGPQGTLYGRNATGGAINVIPNRPQLNKSTVDAVASYGNYNALTAQGAVNLPIGDKAAFRIAGNYASHDPFYNDGTNDQSEYGARVQLYAELTPTLNTRISADFAHQGGAKLFATYVGTATPNFGQTGFTGYTFTPTNYAPGEGIFSPKSQAYLASHYIVQAGRAGEVVQGRPYNDNNFWGILSETNWSVGPGTLTLVPAYRESKLDNLITPGMNGAGTKEKDRQFSTELRYAGKAGAFDFVLGGYYFGEHVRANTYFSQFVLVPYQNFTTTTDSYAGFGKLTWHASEKLSLTAAGRYTQDKKRFDGISDTYILFCGNPATFPPNQCPTLPFIPLLPDAASLRAFYAANGIPVTNVPLFALPPAFGGSQTAPFVLNAPTSINAGLSNTKFTYRLGADYRFSSGSMAYVSYETGYHAGGFAFAQGLESYKPETIQAWTIGSKNRFLDNKVQFNIEGFYWKYRNQQFSTFGFDLGTPPTTVFLTRNVGSSTIYGFDADAQFLLTRNTLLSASVQYVHTRYDSFLYDVPNQGPPPPTMCGAQAGNSVINGVTEAVYHIDCSGQPAVNTPAWSFNINAQQTVPLGDYKIVLQAGTRYRGPAQEDPSYSSYIYAKAGTTSNAAITFGPADERWSVTGFINNIEDYRRVFAVSQVAASGIYIGSYEAPRSYGIRLAARFR
ncbi:TonB-dependent receptor [Sphingomonas sp. RT2P30]|uniref:TonB-dependent receptor n=1 Tax=Parasphingomonas halimpatiens TaxID=3096162 RepID=UPI002FC82896